MCVNNALTKYIDSLRVAAAASLLRLGAVATRSFFLLIGTLLFVGCKPKTDIDIPLFEVDVDLDSIRSRGVLRAVTDYNSVNYFVYKGVTVGFQYELLTCYAEHLGLRLEVIPDNSLQSAYEKLEDGQADILASTLVADTALLPTMRLCEPYGQSRIVPVRHVDLLPPNSQNSAGGAETPSVSKTKSGTKTEATEAILSQWFENDTLYVSNASFFLSAIHAYADTAEADNLVIVPIEHYDAEQMVCMTAEKEIGQTLCLESTARALKWYYDDLQIGPPLTPELDLAWGVRAGASSLAEDISLWLKKFKRTTRFKRIFRKYVIDPREHHSNSQSTKLDTYSDVFETYVKATATNARYDWQLLSSVIYQESHFNPNATSWAGAVGLMQLMPETAVRFGVSDPRDPQQSIAAGYDFLLWLDDRLVAFVPNGQERVKFVLAAYNVGLGHVMDAIRLAKKFGKNETLWYDNVETALLLKANPAFYADPVVKHGYCRGTETIAYVRNVLTRAAAYRKGLK